MKESITFELCDWVNEKHTAAFLYLLNHYMSDPMGNHPPLTYEEQQN